jgi:hypothetical protein
LALKLFFCRSINTFSIYIVDEVFLCPRKILGLGDKNPARIEGRSGRGGGIKYGMLLIA